MKFASRCLAISFLIAVCCVSLLPGQSPVNDSQPAVSQDNPAPPAAPPASLERQDPNALKMPAKLPAPKGLDEVIARLVYREKERMAMMTKLTPLVETYIQDLQPDPVVPPTDGSPGSGGPDTGSDTDPFGGTGGEFALPQVPPGAGGFGGGHLSTGGSG
jgi:hypothetical protein